MQFSHRVRVIGTNENNAINTISVYSTKRLFSYSFRSSLGVCLQFSSLMCLSSTSSSLDVLSILAPFVVNFLNYCCTINFIKASSKLANPVLNDEILHTVTYFENCRILAVLELFRTLVFLTMLLFLLFTYRFLYNQSCSFSNKRTLNTSYTTFYSSFIVDRLQCHY
jgi:hypothetical protein